MRLSDFRWYRRWTRGRWAKVTGYFWGKRWIRVPDECVERCEEDWRAADQYEHLRADGWPLCPRCGEDEAYSLALPADPRDLVGCYYCHWKRSDGYRLRGKWVSGHSGWPRYA